MENKWTPGPWIIERYKEPHTSFIDDINIVADGLVLAKLGKELSPENTANAHLIAAAPELYEALFNMMEIYHGRAEQSYPGQMAKDAMKALAKARGETGERGE